MFTWDTSNNPSSSLRMSANAESIVLEHLPENGRYNKIMITITGPDGNEVYRQYSVKRNNTVINLRGVYDGNYFLNVYFHFGDAYWSYYPSHQPTIVKSGSRCWFSSPPLTTYNSIQMHSWPVTSDFLKRNLVSTSQYQCKRQAIVECAQAITQRSLFPYTKMMAIHDFVAQHIAYDMDALSTGKYRYNDNSALATLHHGKGVCQGYTNLSIALLRALGIPAMEVESYALGQDTAGGWEDSRNSSATSANHVLTAAYVNHRWRVMDITWDSDLVVINGERTKKTGTGISHRYFDTTPSMLSLSHKIIQNT
ncbi:MAG: transglutaminase domain-containing protein [Prevotella sp.]|nr:transglutaminase domain-containing protein [Prevotella sp.]